MTITEFAILVFKSPPDLSNPALQSLFRKLSVWQSESSGFPLHFFHPVGLLSEIHLVTGWTSVAAHEAWIRGERNQELLRAFAPYVDMPRVRMVHIDMDFETIQKGVGCMVIERYDGQRWGGESQGWSLAGRDLARDGGDMYRVFCVAGNSEGDVGGVAPIERWVLKRVELDWATGMVE